MEQISMSVRGPTFAPTATGNITDTESIYVPNSPSAFPPAAEGFDHKQPVAVQSQGDTYVVFAYDAGGSYAIVLRSMTSDLDAVQGMGSPCAVSDATGDPGNLTSPSVAVSSINGSDVFFIAWQDDPGNIYGRTYTPTATGACGTLGAQVLLSTGTANSHPSVAGVTSNNPAGTPGWVVVWQSDQIALLPIGGDGSPVHAQKLLGPGTAPTVASIPGTGNYTVAWSDVTLAGSAAIFALRFGAESSPIDSTPAQISESSNGDEATPFIAGSPAGGGSYVVTWVDQGGNQEVRARLLSNMVGGYLSNAIDGTTGEFIVSDVAGQTPNLRTRVSPTVVVGGASPGYMAFGWADNTASGTFGILGRRFPLPAQ